MCRLESQDADMRSAVSVVSFLLIERERREYTMLFAVNNTLDRCFMCT